MNIFLILISLGLLGVMIISAMTAAKIRESADFKTEPNLGTAYSYSTGTAVVSGLLGGTVLGVTLYFMFAGASRRPAASSGSLV